MAFRTQFSARPDWQRVVALLCTKNNPASLAGRALLRCPVLGLFLKIDAAIKTCIYL